MGLKPFELYAFTPFEGNVVVSKWFGGIVQTHQLYRECNIGSFTYRPSLISYPKNQIKLLATDFVEIKPRRSNRQANV
jgi:hypothetical protein